MFKRDEKDTKHKRTGNKKELKKRPKREQKRDRKRE